MINFRIICFYFFLKTLPFVHGSTVCLNKKQKCLRFLLLCIAARVELLPRKINNFSRELSSLIVPCFPPFYEFNNKDNKKKTQNIIFILNLHPNNWRSMYAIPFFFLSVCLSSTELQHPFTYFPFLCDKRVNFPSCRWNTSWSIKMNVKERKRT